MPIGRLHVVTDTRPGRDPIRTVSAALDAGAPVVQVRGKQLTDRELYELAGRVAELCAAHGALCVVNDRPDVALAVDAGGVHVGADDLPVPAARRVLGPCRVLGATARDVATARSHEAAGASYLGVGPAYATTTKSGLPDPLGPAGVGAIARAVTIARATRREARSSPNRNKRSASSRSGSVLTRVAAVLSPTLSPFGPCRPMRISSGPSDMKEKPRAGSSI